MYVFKKKKKQVLLIRDGRKYCTQTVVDPGDIQQRLKPREGWPHVRSLTVLYIIFERRGNPFVYLILINRTPFTSLRGRRLKGKGKGIRARDHARRVPPPLLPRTPLTFLSRLKLPFPKLPFSSLSNACHAGYPFTYLVNPAFLLTAVNALSTKYE